MKITGRMHVAVRKYHDEHGKWPTSVSIGHAELKELSDHFGYVPATVTFGYVISQMVSVSIRLADTDTELSCSTNG